MKSSVLKIIVAGLGSMAILTIMYFGAYLPFKKSSLYIQAVSDVSKGRIQTLQDFTDEFYAALNFYSPVGQDEEVSYYTGGILLNVINSVMTNQKNGPQIVEGLLTNAERWIEPIVKVGKGFNYSQNLLNFALLYKSAAQQLRNEAYLEKSADYFKMGLAASPNRYVFLDGLFEIYQIEGNKEGMKEMGNTILKYWPDRQSIRDAIKGL